MDTLHLALLVLRCQAGDEEAFGWLFRTFAPRTLSYLRGLVGDEAEDIHQEVWLTVYRQLTSLADPRVFHTWLYRLTRHRAIDFLRRRRRTQELFVGGEGAEDLAEVGQATREADDSMIPEGLLDQLAPLQREAVLLRFREELSYAEIAAITGCSIGTVRSRLFYARQRLAELAKRTSQT